MEMLVSEPKPKGWTGIQSAGMNSKDSERENIVSGIIIHRGGKIKACTGNV